MCERVDSEMRKRKTCRKGYGWKEMKRPRKGENSNEEKPQVDGAYAAF